jgi:hypothetical protein
MSILHVEKLRKLAPPLEAAPENVVDWAMAEKVYDLVFPEDFKKFIGVYGNVMWWDLFRPIYPRTESLDACRESKESVVRLLASMYSAKLWNENGEVVDIPPYPKPEGLLPCFLDTNGDIVCWHTVGEPDQWKVVVFQEGNLFFFPFDVTQLICDWVEHIPPASGIWRPFDIRPRQIQLAVLSRGT